MAAIKQPIKKDVLALFPGAPLFPLSVSVRVKVGSSPPSPVYANIILDVAEGPDSRMRLEGIPWSELIIPQHAPLVSRWVAMCMH